MSGSNLARAQALVAPYWVVGVVLLAGFSVVAGGFDGGRAAWWGGLVAVALAAAIAVDARDRLAQRRSRRPLFAVEGPLLWLVGAYAVLRGFGAYGAHLTPVVAALLGGLWALAPRPTAIKVAVAAGLLELGLTFAGRQEVPLLLLHGLTYAGAAWGLSRFARLEAFRRQVARDQARAEEQAGRKERQREFGLATDQAPALGSLPVVGEQRPTVGSFALDHVERAFALEVEVLQHAMGLAGAVVLWHDPQTNTFSIRGVAGDGPWVDGPFPDGIGLAGSALRDATEVAVAPLLPGAGGLPYRSGDTSAVGAALAVPLPGGGDKPLGILCVDRARSDRFTESERLAVRLAARKLALDVEVSQRLKQVDTENTTVGRINQSLQALNGALGLEQSAAAAVQAARTLVQADLVVLSVVKGDLHQVLRAEGQAADRLVGLQFTPDEGLVGRAITHGRTLPVGGTWRGAQGVFTAGDKLEEMRSLLIVPLLRTNGGPVGALTVAARVEGAFGPRQHTLELIAAQVAVKLDLALAHDRIQEMASVDGLTGLANHRVFQQAYDNMLVRARRQRSALCLVLFDIDHFKRINDTYGHPFGDGVLKGVARVLGAAVRKVDLAARYGGEEFALLLEGSDLEGGRRLVERIRSEVETLRFEAPQEAGQVAVQVTLSAGLAVFPGDGDSKVELIDRADKALYQAKAQGRNRAVAWAELAPLV